MERSDDNEAKAWQLRGARRALVGGILSSRLGTSRESASTRALERGVDACWVGVLLAGTILAMTGCYEEPRICTGLITVLACLSLVRFRERADLVAGVVGLVLGPLAEWAATSAGLWRYAYPQWGGLPGWVFPMWWLFPMAIRRLIRAAGAEPAPSGVGLPLAAMAVEIAWLCTWGIPSPWVALAGLGVLAAGLLAQSRTRADAVAMVCCGVIGPLAEWVPLRAGAFHYPAGSWLGLPVWLPLGYAVLGLALIRLSTAIQTRLGWGAFLTRTTHRRGAVSLAPGLQPGVESAPKVPNRFNGWRPVVQAVETANLSGAPDDTGLKPRC